MEADSWDVYFPAPLSLSLVANTFAHNGMQRELGQLLDLHDAQVDAIAADIRLLAPESQLDVTSDERLPVVRVELAAVATTAWQRYSARLRAETTEALGIGWDPLPEDPTEGASDEVRVMGLPRPLHVTGGGSGVCLGYFGPHEQIMAA